MDGFEEKYEQAVTDPGFVIHSMGEYQRALSGLTISMKRHRNIPGPLRGAIMNHVDCANILIDIHTGFLKFILKYMHSPDNDGRKWTEAETEAVVLRRAEGESLESIALDAGRSVQAVANRITMAVGIKQLEVQINGMIDGDLQGEHAEGMFQGTLRKVSK